MIGRPGIALALAAAGGALALDGPQAFGRVALALGWPAPALMQEDALRGLALHAQGRWLDAAEAFRAAGPTESYNRADALARAGDHANALAAYAAVLARDPEDWRARQNRDLVRALYDAPLGEILPGTEAAGDGTGAQDALSPFDEAVAADGGAEKLAEQRRSALQPVTAQSRAEQVRRTPDAAAQVASRRWLATFPDDPGLWLAAVIAAEHDRRARAGLTPPAPVDPR